jgi:hypothetical protein
MSAAIPASIRVGERDIPITVERTDRWPDHGGPVRGEYRRKTQSIHLSDTAPPASMRDVVLHEVMHHLAHESGLADRYKPATVEFFISSLDAWLLEVLRENPALVAYLVS